MSPWIGNTFDNFTLKCPDGSKWRISEKISEKSVEFHAYSNSGELYAEAQAVYLCRQIIGPHVGMEAIVKVRMQVPTKHSSKPYAQGLAYPTATEISTLQYFTEKGCSVVPRLLHCLVYSQDPNMPIPGGYMAILVMEKCPGVVLSDFWSFEESKKEKIRKAFLRDFSWFIDHEQTFIFEEREIEPYKADRRDLEEWDLEKFKRIDFQALVNGAAEATWD
ncbi:uncharacterized protein ARB_06721 [Trichophyton benhamiae CBS 112371]|uniref:Uncharacterized protein n=1 Tax=Arthroderma benhamiae (strain ATCC MYA-4681 / CBS 112371) TaxID=663331 RepID=D4ARH8_ARTBC|nr:uncharacterized protein ARB_06721 [Trichophyton benhamiae CBS 112371]EFE34321.1 hypothetical protein ARB_06721 [Trichophyton benhamiae CBS 112371]